MHVILSLVKGHLLSTCSEPSRLSLLSRVLRASQKWSLPCQHAFPSRGRGVTRMDKTLALAFLACCSSWSHSYPPLLQFVFEHKSALACTMMFELNFSSVSLEIINRCLTWTGQGSRKLQTELMCRWKGWSGLAVHHPALCAASEKSMKNAGSALMYAGLSDLGVATSALRFWFSGGVGTVRTRSARTLA